jgi:hypothetical protein
MTWMPAYIYRVRGELTPVSKSGLLQQLFEQSCRNLVSRSFLSYTTQSACFFSATLNGLLTGKFERSSSHPDPRREVGKHDVAFAVG